MMTMDQTSLSLSALSLEYHHHLQTNFAKHNFSKMRETLYKTRALKTYCYPKSCVVTRRIGVEDVEKGSIR